MGALYDIMNKQVERVRHVRCAFCGFGDSRVIDSRAAEDGGAIRRRRECPACGKRFTTFERLEETPILVVKKDGRRERFDRNKLLSGLLKAFEKRPTTMERIQEFVDLIERELRTGGEAEVPTERIGELVMQHLPEVDQVAYVRFASVYRQFGDLNNFMQELQRIMTAQQNRKDAKE